MSRSAYPFQVRLELVVLVVEDYDDAIAFFVDVLGFEVIEDSTSLTNEVRPKRWVVVRPPGAATGLLLARADGAQQNAVVGNQVAGRVGFFLRVDDFAAAHRRMADGGERPARLRSGEGLLRRPGTTRHSGRTAGALERYSAIG
jgi:catechol 2,3-dioxygenase-like lactoylglutathione lyase family enzyme